MGVSIKELTTKEKTSLEAFASRIVAIDAYNTIYQFITSIRGADGAHLTDSRGRVTSHLSGLFQRNIVFLSIGISPIYVFDGKPPSLKSAEIERRRQIKKDATVKYEMALAAGDMEGVRRYAQQMTSILDSMITESKHLLKLLGIPYVDAPSEGEATAAYMSSSGLAYASASQDYDSILFGAKRLIRNFTNSGRRKIPNKNAHINVVPEIIESEKMLGALQITREQLVDVGIMVGTDFNPGGFTRIGPKTALKLIRRHGKLEEIPQIQEQLHEIDYKSIRRIFLEPEIPEIGDISLQDPDRARIVEYLSERDFNEDRVRASLSKLERSQERRSQSLDKWF